MRPTSTPSRRSVLIAAALTLLAAAPGCKAEPVRLRVLTYNIHHGAGADGKIDLPRLAEVIKSVEPDVVALQEVDNRTGRSGGVDQAAELGKLTGMTAYFAKAMDYDGGGYGEAVLSKLSVLESKTIALPADKGFEPRAAGALRVRLPGGEALWFLGTHLDHTRDPKQRNAQADTLLEAVDPMRGPVILAGDMNAEPGSEPMRKLLAHFGDAAQANPQPTYPADKPRIRIDWVLVRPESAWRVVEARTLDEPVASDHAPLLVVLERIGAAAEKAEDDARTPGQPDPIDRVRQDMHRITDRPGK